ncbi:MAG TPA: zf-HC2 domain-containing protein [Thermoleophilaceae bacterium]
MTCEETRELAPELALGIADGAERAQALSHLAQCADCRRAVAELSEVTDELLMLAPEHEPPVGFESRVLARLEPGPAEPAAAPAPSAARVPRRRWRRRFTAVLAPVAAAALTAVLVLNLTSDDRRLADQYRSTLAEANGQYFEATQLYAPAHVPAGVAYGYRGKPSWVFVTVKPPFRSTDYDAELALKSGRRLPLTSLRIDPKTGSGGQAIPVDLRKVASVRLIGPQRGDVLEGDMPHAGLSD